MMNLVVMLPTYNERQSIGSLLSALSELEIDEVTLSILVIDDNSPDGTANYVESLKLPNVDILRRPIKDGLGNAYKSGIEKILQDSRVTHLISMDADSSHRIVDLINLIKTAQSNPNADLIIGSRWVPGGGIEN
mgnify:FL=1